MRLTGNRRLNNATYYCLKLTKLNNSFRVHQLVNDLRVATDLQCINFECTCYEQVEAVVNRYAITPDDYTFGPIKKGTVSPVFLVPVISSKLQQLFKTLFDTFPNKHTLIQGKFESHVTLCWLKEQLELT